MAEGKELSFKRHYVFTILHDLIGKTLNGSSILKSYRYMKGLLQNKEGYFITVRCVENKKKPYMIRQRHNFKDHIICNEFENCIMSIALENVLDKKLLDDDEKIWYKKYAVKFSEPEFVDGQQTTDRAELYHYTIDFFNSFLDDNVVSAFLRILNDDFDLHICGLPSITEDQAIDILKKTICDIIKE